MVRGIHATEHVSDSRDLELCRLHARGFDVVLILQRFVSPLIGSVHLGIFPDGTYRISIDAAGNGIITENYETSNDCSGHVVRTTSPPSQSSGVLFSSYFSSNTLDAGGSREYVTGKIPPGSNRVNGVLQWIDEQSVEVFSLGTTRITVPVHVTLTWDITLQ